MQTILANMILFFENLKAGGGYFILLLISLYAIYSVNKEKQEWSTNKEVHESTKKSRWLCAYTIAIIVLVVGNPLVIFILSNIFATIGDYTYITLLIPSALLIPYGIVLLLYKAGDKRRQRIFVGSTIIVIGLAGSGYGLSSERVNNTNFAYISNETKEVVEYLVADENEGIVLAAENIIEEARRYTGDVEFLYGKDLWTYGLDLGIMDAYSEEMMSLYLAMQNPEECIEDIVAVAQMYGCEVLVLERYEDYEKQISSYQLAEEFDQYLVYEIVQ
ncbi:MAG: hypothetical protein R3Y24_13980 [Eubacteriales bacterium]